ncbi:MAG: reverse transcriptase family protein [Sedimenticola sp.]
MWHRRHNGRVTPLSIEDDRIIGIHVLVSERVHLYVFQMYLPSRNHPISKYRDYVEKVENLVSLYAEKGIVVLMGDVNAHLQSKHFIKRSDDRGKCFEKLLLDKNLISANTLEMCTGARSSFVSYNGEYESLIDHIILPVEKQDTILTCEIADDNSLNVSNHRPVLCCVNIPHFTDCKPMDPSSNINWKRVKQEHIELYSYNLMHDTEILFALSMNMMSTDEIDKLYSIITSSICDVSTNSIPKTKFRHYLKPYWNPELQNLHNDMKCKRIRWINAGQPRGNTYQCYSDYKAAKRAFRRLHKNGVDKYMSDLNSEIDTAAEMDNCYFWRLVSSRKNRSCASPGVEMTFNGETIRNPEHIVNHWGLYFKELYQPSELDQFSSSFNETTNAELNYIKCFLSGDNNSCEYMPISDDDVAKAVKCSKTGKACGEDRVYYEHIKYGGECVIQLLKKLFNSMLKFSYMPHQMKRGVIITLFKGGNKKKDDPNNYRAITLSSVILKLYERILLSRMELQVQPPMNKLQGGFQKQIGCVMTSLMLKECIHFAKEHDSKLYVCFLDVKKAFDTVWHAGLFVKLFRQGVKWYELKAVMNMYEGMSSCVKSRGYQSDWIQILQGTRQGGVCSPFFYLMYINQLLCELESSDIGFVMYNVNGCCPTVADDMILMSYSKFGLQNMINMCNSYSNKWRYQYNASKSAVVVFNESHLAFQRNTRHWQLAGQTVTEREQYTHLGVICDKYLDDTASIKMCNTKLRGTLLSLSNCGIGTSDLHPLTLLKIYRSVVLSKALYGSELWNQLSASQISVLERGHRFSVKYIQSLPTATRTDIAQSIAGFHSLEIEIDKRKLSFFGQLCLLPVETRIKDIFSVRLVSFVTGQRGQRGFMPDIFRILEKYSLLEYVNNYVSTGRFVSKYTWKSIVNKAVNVYAECKWHDRMQTDTTLSKYKHIHTVVNPFHMWYLSKLYPKYSRQCKNSVFLLAKLFDYERSVCCVKCGICTQSIAEHIILYCWKVDQCRDKFWRLVFDTFGETVYLRYMSLSGTDQIQAMFSGYQLGLDQEDFVHWTKLVVTTLHSMVVTP